MSRPEILFSLFAPVTALAGVGPRIGRLIEKLAGPHVVDLLWHLPNGLIDRRFAPKIAAAPAGVVATITVRVEAHTPAYNRRAPYKVRCSDDTGTMDLIFFHANAEYLGRILPEGEVRVVSGKVEHYDGMVQMTHPDHIGTSDDIVRLKSVAPVYPMTGGLTPKPLIRAIREAVSRAPNMVEWQDAAWIAQRGWAAWREALRAAHAPNSEAALQSDSPARARLAYDELFANQLALLLVRAHQRHLPGRAIAGDGVLRRKVRASLPFQLTSSQIGALEEITHDMASTRRMLRLLQGDVGSGKTVVAFLAMLNAVESGAQAALMAPTEILVRQHFATMEKLAAVAGVELAVLTGREKGRLRKSILDRLVAGEIRMIVGTHALFQEDIAFSDLAFVVIDEQHRFGVHQR